MTKRGHQFLVEVTYNPGINLASLIGRAVNLVRAVVEGFEGGLLLSREDAAGKGHRNARSLRRISSIIT